MTSYEMGISDTVLGWLNVVVSAGEDDNDTTTDGENEDTDVNNNRSSLGTMSSYDRDPS
jgi:hypothetical protein